MINSECSPDNKPGPKINFDYQFSIKSDCHILLAW